MTLTPLAADSAMFAPEEQPGGWMESNATVLVVEDDETILRLATRVLERGGYKVLAAATGVTPDPGPRTPA